MNLTKTIEEEYAEITEKPLDTVKQMHQKNLSDLLEIYENFLHKEDELFKKNPFLNSNQMYSALQELFEEKKKDPSFIYDQEDITSFCFALEKYQTNGFFTSSGIFLSFLINTHFEKTDTKKEYSLFTEHLEKKVNYLAFKNKGAHIFIRGDAGFYLADYMERGSVTITGSTFEPSDYFRGGLILRNTEKKKVVMIAIDGEKTTLCCEKSEVDNIIDGTTNSELVMNDSIPNRSHYLDKDTLVYGMSFSPKICNDFMNGKTILIHSKEKKSILAARLQNKEIIYAPFDETD